MLPLLRLPLRPRRVPLRMHAGLPLERSGRRRRSALCRRPLAVALRRALGQMALQAQELPCALLGLLCAACLCLCAQHVYVRIHASQPV